MGAGQAQSQPDYDALAAQAGAVPDYDALAQQAGAVQPQTEFAPPPGTPSLTTAAKPNVNVRPESVQEALGGNDLQGVANSAQDFAQQVGGRVEHNLQAGADALGNASQTISDAMNVRNPHSVAGLEKTAKSMVPDYDLTRSTIPKVAGDVVTGALLDMPEDKAPQPYNNIVRDKYSRPADHLAAGLRSNARIDVPAEAHIAHDAIAEGLADAGFSSRDFQGRNGPHVLDRGIDNALRIHEARAQSVIDPVRGDLVDPKVLSQNPELAKQPEVANKIAQGQPVTYGDVDAARVRLNKQLRRISFYAKDPTMQTAMDLEMEDAVNQARDLVYSRAEAVTGHDLRPLKRTESALLKLKDLNNVTKNTLVGKDSRFQTESPVQKLVAKGRTLAGAASNPISSFFSYERMGASPLDEFNSNMRKSFANVAPQRANLSLPHAAGPAHPPVPTLELTPPPGRVPPAGQDQLPFNEGDTRDMQTGPNGPLNLTSEGRVPAATQQDLNFNGADQGNPGTPENPREMPPSSRFENQKHLPNGNRRVTPRNGHTFTEAERQKFLAEQQRVEAARHPNKHLAENPFDRHPSHKEVLKNHDEAATDVLSGRKPRGQSIVQ